MIIGVSGKARSGKGEFAKIARDEYGAVIVNFAGALKEEVMFFLQKYEIPFTLDNIYGENQFREQKVRIDHEILDPDDLEWFRDFLALYAFRAYTTTWEFTYRSLLQWWGTEFRRKEDVDYWVKRAMEKCITGQKIFNKAIDKGNYNIARIEEPLYVIDDLRFENEAQGILDAGGKLVRVERPNNPNPISNPYHPSECSLDDWIVWEWVIENTESLEDYREGCRIVLTDMLGVEPSKGDANVGCSNCSMCSATL